MFTRLRLLIFSIAVFALGATLIVHGAQSASVARRFTKPETISLEKLIDGEAKEGWFRVEEGVLSVFHASWRSRRTGNSPVPTNRDIQVLYIPLIYRDQVSRLASDPTERHPIYVVVRTRDSDLRGTVERLRSTFQTQGEPPVDQMTASQPDILVERTVEGTLRRPNALDAIALKQLWGKVDANCVILEEGGKPVAGSGASREIVFGVCLILGLPLLWFLASRVADRPDGVVGEVGPALVFNGGPSEKEDAMIVMPGAAPSSEPRHR